MKTTEKENEIGFYFRINPELKKEFNIKCLKNETTMTEVIIDGITEYLKQS